MARSIDSISKQSKKPAEPVAEAPKEAVVPPAEEPVAEAEKPATPPTESAETLAAAGETPAPATPPAGESFESLFPEPSVIMSGPPSWVWWILLILGSVALGFLAFDLTRGKIDTWLAVSATATPSPSASASTAATAAAVPTSASPTPTASSTASASPVASPSSPTTSDVTPTAASVSLRILNGTTITGAAAKSKDLLAKAGFNVKSVGNAKTQNYSSTFVYYQAGKQAQANLVQQTLKDTYSVTLQESPLAQPDDVLIVIGKK